MKIWDCFLFHNETEMLKLRVEELSPVVDGFVMVQGEKTFTGVTRKIIDAPTIPNSREFRSVVVERPEGITARQTEYHYRNSILRAFKPGELGERDVLLISDADEIPNPQVIHSLRCIGMPSNKVRFQMQFHYYFLDCLQNAKWQPWMQSIAITWGLLRNSWPQQERMQNRVGADSFTPIAEGGWHFSFFGPPQRVWESIFSHADDEARNAEILTVADVERIMEKGQDIFGRDLPPVRFLDSLPNLPHTIENNLDYYRTLGWIRG